MCEVRGERRGAGTAAVPPARPGPIRHTDAPSPSCSTNHHGAHHSRPERPARHPVCLGTMTFGEQVDEADAHAILDRSLERGVDFIDTAEMYAVPTREETFGATETIIGNWFATQPRRAPQDRAGHQGGRPVARHAVGARRQRHDGGRHRGLVRCQPEPPADRRDRPLPDPLARTQRAGLRRDRTSTRPRSASTPRSTSSSTRWRGW